MPKISYRGWRRCGAIGASGTSGASGASGGVAGVEPDGVDIDLGGVGVNLGVGRLNSNYLKSIEESIEESFYAFKIFESESSLRIILIVKDISELIKRISYLLFTPPSKSSISRNSINSI